jgi:hypothetical protein
MDQNIKDQTLDKLTKAESILIAVSPSFGFEGLAAGLSMYLSLLKLDKNVSINARPPSVSDAQKLYGVNRVGKLEGVKNPVVVVENAVETVDKVTYFLEGTKLKVIIHPLPGTHQISQDQISIEYTSTPANLIFSLGFNSLPELRSSFTLEQEISPESWIININNNKSSQKFAQIEIVHEDYSTISEIVAKIIQELALPIDEDVAYNLYSGIREGTESFLPSKTNPSSFDTASWLIKFGAGKASLAKPSSAQEPQRKLFDDSKQKLSEQKFINNNQYQIQKQESSSARPTTINQVEKIQQQRPLDKKEWLKPPKIYKGSKSFDTEN